MEMGILKKWGNSVTRRQMDLYFKTSDYNVMVVWTSAGAFMNPMTVSGCPKMALIDTPTQRGVVRWTLHRDDRYKHTTFSVAYHNAYGSVNVVSFKDGKQITAQGSKLKSFGHSRNPCKDNCNMEYELCAETGIESNQ